MAHFRKQIRDAVRARLAAALGDAAAVHSGRLTPFRDAECHRGRA